MLTIIICAIIGIIFCIREVNTFAIDSWDYLWALFIGAVLGAFLGFVIAIIVPTKTETKIDVYPIEALQDTEVGSGTFFLGFGQVGDKMKYSFYYETEGGYRLRQVDSDSTLIKSTYVLPRVEEYSRVPAKNRFWNRFSLYLRCAHENSFVIYVPEGSIKQNYNLDAI